MQQQQAIPNSSPENGVSTGSDPNWVWREVRKRVFIKLPFSMTAADALAAAIPIALDGDHFVVGFDEKHTEMVAHLNGGAVRNTIEGILRDAAGRSIHFDVIEGASLEDWHRVRDRRQKAEAAVIAMASQKTQEHHFEDMMNQMVGEIRSRVTQNHERTLPQVRARMIMEVARALGDAEHMLFDCEGADEHRCRRLFARMIDRVASIMEVDPIVFALEIEHIRKENMATGPKTASA